MPSQGEESYEMEDRRNSQDRTVEGSCTDNLDQSSNSRIRLVEVDDSNHIARGYWLS